MNRTLLLKILLSVDLEFYFGIPIPSPSVVSVMRSTNSYYVTERISASSFPRSTCKWIIHTLLRSFMMNSFIFRSFRDMEVEEVKHHTLMTEMFNATRPRLEIPVTIIIIALPQLLDLLPLFRSVDRFPSNLIALFIFLPNAHMNRPTRCRYGMWTSSPY